MLKYFKRVSIFWMGYCRLRPLTWLLKCVFGISGRAWQGDSWRSAARAWKMAYPSGLQFAELKYLQLTDVLQPPEIWKGEELLD